MTSHSPTSPVVTASIVAYRNDPAQLQTAVKSFFAVNGLPVAMVVVDNSPSDTLRALIVREGAEYLWDGKNVGFGAGHNIAMRHFQGRAPYHLILNPDVEF